jgi:hypothetical protein
VSVMVATIGDLLDQTDLSNTRPTTLDHDELLAGWRLLVPAACRALDAVPLPAVSGTWSPQLRATLRRLELGRLRRTSFALEPDAAMAGVALRVGAVADLLVDVHPAMTESDVASAWALQGRLLGTLHHAARYTLPGVNQQTAGWLDLLEVARLTQPWAGDTGRQPSRYDDVAAIRYDDRSIEGAVQAWRRAAGAHLNGRFRTTALGFQTIAADLAILASMNHALLPEGGAAGEHLVAAHRHWRALSNWPTSLTYPGARDPGLSDASMNLRDAVKAFARRGRRWATPDELAAGYSPRALLGIQRRVAEASLDVAHEFRDALDGLVRGDRRLWTATAEISAEWKQSAPQKYVRDYDWLILDHVGQRAARPLLRQAWRALDATQAAADGFRGLTVPEQTRAEEPSGVPCWEHVPSVPRRRPPDAVARRPDHAIGPRR